MLTINDLIQGSAFNPEATAPLAALKHTETSFPTSMLRQLNHTALFEALIEQDPKYMEDLVSTRQVRGADVAAMLELKHTPSVKIANRVATHRKEALPEAAHDYVMAHGGRAALRDMLFNQVEFLTQEQRDHLQKVLFTDHHLLTFPTTIDYVGLRTVVDTSDWLHQITVAVDLLSQVTEKHTKDKSFEATQRRILQMARCAGVSVPDSVDRSAVEHLTAAQMLDHIVKFSAKGGLRGFSSNTTQAMVTLLYNDEVLQLLPSLSPADLEHVMFTWPSWPAYELLLASSRKEEVLQLVRTGQVLLPRKYDDVHPRLEVLLQLPTQELPVGYGWNHRGIGVDRILAYVAEEFEEDTAKWSTFAALLPEWEESLEELVETVHSANS